jgi:hypothetical protein
MIGEIAALIGAHVGGCVHPLPGRRLYFENRPRNDLEEFIGDLARTSWVVQPVERRARGGRFGDQTKVFETRAPFGTASVAKM